MAEDGKAKQTDLAVVQEGQENANSQESDENQDEELDDFDKVSEPSPEKPPEIKVERKMLDKKGTSNLDMASMISG